MTQVYPYYLLSSNSARKQRKTTKIPPNPHAIKTHKPQKHTKTQHQIGRRKAAITRRSIAPLNGPQSTGGFQKWKLTQLFAGEGCLRPSGAGRDEHVGNLTRSRCASPLSGLYPNERVQ
jgi:hypothetical protein